MSPTSLKPPPGAEPTPSGKRASRVSTAGRAWIAVALAVVAIAAIMLVWARTRPGYDPYGWLVWGHQTLRLSLNLGGAPSWKPLPYMFTVPFALAGNSELWLWMITAAAIALAGSVFAGRIAFRITGGAAAMQDPDPFRRYAPVAAAIFAGAAVLGIEGYAHYILSAQSDPVIVSLCLAAIDMYLCRRYRWAYVLAVLAALGRPEVWPFLGLFTIWAWVKVPSMRWMLVAGIAVTAFMWFGIPWITNGRPDIAGELAMKSPRELHQGRVTGTIGRFTELQYLPVMLAALAGVAFGALRRDRTVLMLAAGVVLWVIVEIAFALHGFPALPRYMFEAAGVVAVLAGIGIGWLMSELPRVRPGLPPWAGIPIVAVLVVALLPGAVARVQTEHRDLRHERGRTDEIQLLSATINALGGYRRIRACGEPVTGVEYASALAWLTGLNVSQIGYRPGHERRRRYQIVLFTPAPLGGWTVRPWHTIPSKRARCRDLRADFLVTARPSPGRSSGADTTVSGRGTLA